VVSCFGKNGFSDEVGGGFAGKRVPAASSGDGSFWMGKGTALYGRKGGWGERIDQSQELPLFALCKRAELVEL